MNMEPNNHQKTKEKSSEPNLNFWRFSMFIKPRVYYLDFCVSISEESRLLTVFFRTRRSFGPISGKLRGPAFGTFLVGGWFTKGENLPQFSGWFHRKMFELPPTSHMSHETLDDHLVLWNNQPFISRRHVWMSEKKVLPYYTLYVRIWSISPPTWKKKKKNYISKKNSKVTTSFS